MDNKNNLMLANAAVSNVASVNPWNGWSYFTWPAKPVLYCPKCGTGCVEKMIATRTAPVEDGSPWVTVEESTTGYVCPSHGVLGYLSAVRGK